MLTKCNFRRDYSCPLAQRKQIKAIKNCGVFCRSVGRRESLHSWRRHACPLPLSGSSFGSWFRCAILRLFHYLRARWFSSILVSFAGNGFVCAFVGLPQCILHNSMLCLCLHKFSYVMGKKCILSPPEIMMSEREKERECSFCSKQCKRKVITMGTCANDDYTNTRPYLMRIALALRARLYRRCNPTENIASK